jgi:type I restriction enzyme S subunit
MSEIKRVPELRFGEFSGEWVEDRLEKFCNKIASGKSKHSDNGQYKLYGSTGIIGATDEYSNDGKYILIARVGANAGLTNVIEGQFGVTDNTLVVDLKNTVDIDFILSLLHKYNLNRLVFGSGQPLITGGQLKTLKLNFPSKQEQEKIASFLSSVDSCIEQLSKKEQLLREYKKGVMQKIFLQELRFKDDNGSEFPEWVEKKLGEVGKFYAGGDLHKLDYTKEKDEKHIYPIYANGTGEGLYGYATTFQYNKNCVTVSGRGSLGYANVRKQKFNAIVRLIVIEPKEYIESKFLKEIINSITFAIESTGVPQLTVPQISSYKINLPSLKEQTKIANFLSSLDTKIEQVNKELNLTKEFKKGLLQKMFV